MFRAVVRQKRFTHGGHLVLASLLLLGVIDKPRPMVVEAPFSWFLLLFLSTGTSGWLDCTGLLQGEGQTVLFFFVAPVLVRINSTFGMRISCVLLREYPCACAAFLIVPQACPALIVLTRSKTHSREAHYFKVFLIHRIPTTLQTTKRVCRV